MLNWKWLAPKYRWMTLGGLAILVRIVASWMPNGVETIYSRGIYQGIRWFIDNTVARSPIPLFYFLVAFLLYYIYRAFKSWQTIQSYSIKAKLQHIGLAVGNVLGFIIFTFLVLWGFNYARVPIETQININANTLNLKEIITETKWATQEALDARALIPQTDTFALDSTFLPNGNLQEIMRKHLVKVLKKYNYPTTGRVRGRQLFPKGLLMRFSTSGVYLPWIGEGHVDGGLHSLQLPFTLAHEMAHGYGHGDEGTCNFLAYLACIESGDPFLIYSGKLTYWRYAASEYKYFKPESYEMFRAATLTRGMHNDLAAIYANSDKYPDILPWMRDTAYDTYLKFQGIEEGIENYSRVVTLVRGWRLKD